MESKKPPIYIIANAMLGAGLSGGDRIFIECARRWAKKGHRVRVFLGEEGHRVCQENKLKSVSYKVCPSRFRKSSFIVRYIERIIQGTAQVLRASPPEEERAIIYSASDFWPDSIPALWLKLKNPKICWLAGFYMFAPSPFQEDSPYKGKNFFRGLFYWLTQLPIYYLVKHWADYVFVTSEPDVKKFITDKRERKKIIVVRGGVDITEAKKYLASRKAIPVGKRKYDACFVGRFHYQKGVLELIDIWKKVCQKKKDAKLAMIGIGPLEKEVKEKIKKYGLEKSIDLLGFKDGQEKYQIFKQAKIMVHPATYDSGGMAAAEGMAWGLPGVSFDLEALKTYYPRGMIKTPEGDLDKFAQNILRLIKNGDYYSKISKEAIDLTREVWDWDKRADIIYQRVFL